jgi:histone H3/H4
MSKQLAIVKRRHAGAVSDAIGVGRIVCTRKRSTRAPTDKKAIKWIDMALTVMEGSAKKATKGPTKAADPAAETTERKGRRPTQVEDDDTAIARFIHTSTASDVSVAPELPKEVMRRLVRRALAVAYPGADLTAGENVIGLIISSVSSRCHEVMRKATERSSRAWRKTVSAGVIKDAYMDLVMDSARVSGAFMPSMHMMPAIAEPKPKKRSAAEGKKKRA